MIERFEDPNYEPEQDCSNTAKLYRVYNLIKQDDDERKKPTNVTLPQKPKRKGNRTYKKKPTYILTDANHMEELKVKKEAKDFTTKNIKRPNETDEKENEPEKKKPRVKRPVKKVMK